MQPSSWHFAGVAIEHGLRTLYGLMRTDYVAITLPHQGRDDAAASVARGSSALHAATARADRASISLEQGQVQHVDTPRARRPRGVRVAPNRPDALRLVLGDALAGDAVPRLEAGFSLASTSGGLPVHFLGRQTYCCTAL